MARRECLDLSKGHNAAIGISALLPKGAQHKPRSFVTPLGNIPDIPCGTRLTAKLVLCAESTRIYDSVH